jgi:hypothetical protein
LASSQDCQKIARVAYSRKDIHTVSLRSCQEKFFAFNGEPALLGSLNHTFVHTGYGTLGFNHDACLPVNVFTPNRLILTIFNEVPSPSGAPILNR